MNVVITMVNGLGQLALVAIFFGLVQRLELSASIRAGLLGVVFGLGAAFAMIGASPVLPGVLVGAHAVPIGLAAAFVSLPATLVAGVLAALCRVWIGGSGMPYGILSMVLAGLAGLAWRGLVPPDRRETGTALLLLALMIAVHSVIAILSPVKLPDGLLALYFPSIWATCLAGTVTLGWMIGRENRMLRRERTLVDDAFADPLTGLGNRRALDRWMVDHGLRPDGPEFSVILIDIDHFKTINDRFGHDIGDTVLRRLGAAIKQSVRDVDLVTRYGGEEFLVLLPVAGMNRARMIAERIRRAVAAEPVFEDGGTPVTVTASLGVASSSRHDGRIDLVGAADAALYRAKQNGRNRVELAPQAEIRLPAANQAGTFPLAEAAAR